MARRTRKLDISIRRQSAILTAIFLVDVATACGRPSSFRPRDGDRQAVPRTAGFCSSPIDRDTGQARAGFLRIVEELFIYVLCSVILAEREYGLFAEECDHFSPIFLVIRS